MEPYYYRGEKGTNIGPLELDELDRFHTSGIISDSTMIIEVGSDCWERYDVVCSNVIESLQAASEWTPPELPVDEIAPEQILIEGQTQFTEQALPSPALPSPALPSPALPSPALPSPASAPATSTSVSPLVIALIKIAWVFYAFLIVVTLFLVIGSFAGGFAIADLAAILVAVAVLAAIRFCLKTIERKLNI